MSMFHYFLLQEMEAHTKLNRAGNLARNRLPQNAPPHPSRRRQKARHPPPALRLPSLYCWSLLLAAWLWKDNFCMTCLGNCFILDSGLGIVGFHTSCLGILGILPSSTGIVGFLSQCLTVALWEVCRYMCSQFKF